MRSPTRNVAKSKTGKGTKSNRDGSGGGHGGSDAGDWGGDWPDGDSGDDVVGPVVPDVDPYVAPIPAPAVKIVRIVNPAVTRTALGFTIDGQSYTLNAGQTQNVELADSAVIEFDRGSGNQAARYTITEGVYQFASTPQGWELYRCSDSPGNDAVAAN